MISLHADNSILIQDNNKNLHLRLAKQDTNTIYIGNNNQNITIQQKITLVNNTNTILKEIKKDLSHVQTTKSDISKKFDSLIKQNREKQAKQINALKMKFQNILTTQAQSTDKIDTLQADIDTLITTNETNIKQLEAQISQMQTDITYLMQAFHKGDLEVLSFFGLHVDGIYIDDTFYKGVGVGYERLFNSTLFARGVSLITNITLCMGSEENIIEDEDKTLLLLDIGLKKPFNHQSQNYHSYAKGALGYMAVDESSLYLKLGLGIERYNKKNKIALDLHYLGIFEKESTIIQRHLLGNAEVRKEKSFQNALGLTLSVAFSGF